MATLEGPKLHRWKASNSCTSAMKAYGRNCTILTSLRVRTCEMNESAKSALTLHCIDCKISINNPERRDRLAHRSGFKLLGRQSITPSCFNPLYIPESSTVFVRCLA